MTAALLVAPDAESAARVYYLPFAAQFLEGPLDFLGAEHSAWAPPIAWIYPALLGADLTTVRTAGVVLFPILAALAFRIGLRLHSTPAAIAAAAIVALGPLRETVFPAELPEVPFLMLLALWFWALVESERRRRGPWEWIAGIALGLATLAEPLCLPFVVATVAVCAGLALNTREDFQESATHLLRVHLLALALPLLAILRNAWLFDYPAIATGGGAALYYGHHLLTLGMDPAYFGIAPDAGLVTGEFSPRSIAGDRMLRAAALAAFADAPATELLHLYGAKLAAFLFVSPGESAGPPEWLRAWRIALIVLAGWGAWRTRRPELALLLAMLVVCQAAVHIPTMHSFRESVAALDLPLALLAAVGLADALGHAWRLIPALALVGAGIAVGYVDARDAAPLRPRIEDVPRLLAWSAERNPEAVSFGSLPGFRTILAPTQQARTIVAAVRNAPLLSAWDSAIVVADIQPAKDSAQRCRSIAYAFRRRDETEFGRELVRPVHAEGAAAADTFAATSTLGLATEGDLRITLDCPQGSRVRLEALWIAVPRFGLYYRIRSLGQPPAADLLLPEGVRR